MTRLATNRRAAATRQRPGILGVTSDGVEILRPVRGHRNLTDRQVRQIADGIVKMIRATRAQQVQGEPAAGND